MFPKFSVEKPYTVLVAVVMVIILGVVSFTKMTTDLLPSISLPYVIVMTTYVGASPETVEMVVTDPVESSMATVSNVESISSVSGENYSMVIMEFAQTADMDSVSLEIRENLDQISSYWDDSIGSPVIMKINPDMLPIMVAAVGVEGMTVAEVSEYTRSTLLPELESVEGVASASASGLLEEQIHVLIRQDKIDAVNQQVFGAIEADLEEARQELADGWKEIEEGRAELADGRAELADSRTELADSWTEIHENQTDLEKSRQELADGRAELAQGRTDLQSGKDALNAQKDKAAAELAAQTAQVVDGIAQLEAAKASLPVVIPQLQEEIGKLEANGQDKTALETQSAGISANLEALTQLRIAMGAQEGDTIDQAALNVPENAGFIQAIGAILQDPNWLTNSDTDTWGEVETKLKEAKTLVDQGLGLYAQLEQSQSALTSIDDQIAQLKSALAALTQGEVNAAAGFGSADAQLAYAEAQLEALEKQMESGQDQIDLGQEQIDAAKEQLTDAEEQLTDAEEQLREGEEQLDDAAEQLREGEEQLEESRQQAYISADVGGILTVETVKALLTAQNFSMPGGYITEDDIDYLVRVGDKPEDVEALAAMPIMNVNMEGVDVITLRDVADVFMTDNSADIYTNINGATGVMISMQKQTGYSTGEVSDSINEKFEQMMEEDEKLSLINLMDQGIYIDMVMDSIVSNIVFGAGLAILILILFLRDFRPTLVIAFAIPISLVAAIVCMYFSGVTLNIISLSGLALGIGMLVDNAIVVIENIYRMRKEGVPMREAAIEGAREVGGAIAASTLTTVCVFAPIVFTEGITRQLFVDMGLTIAYSLLASLIMALTVVPALASKILTGTKEEKEGRFSQGFMELYGRFLSLSLRFKPVVLLAVIALLILSGWAAIQKGTAFMPEMDSNQLTVTVTLPEDTPLAETAAATDEIVERLSAMPDIEDIGAMLGGGTLSLTGGSDSEATNSTAVYITTKEEKELTNQELAKEIEAKLSDMKDVTLNIQTASMDMTALSGSGISVNVKGRELDTLQEIAVEVAEILSTVEGTQDVSDGMEDASGELRIIVDREKAMEYGLTVGQVFNEIYARIAAPTTATTLTTEIREYDVYVINEADSQMTRQELAGIRIKYTDKEGNQQFVTLSEIADFEDRESLSSINRSEQTRYISVSASIADGYNVGLVAADVEEALKDYKLPSGYYLEFTGENEMIMDAMEQLMLMLILALAFMYLIMVAQFQSLLSPFIIMFTVPLAFTGGFLGLYLTNSEVSVIAVIGFIMLAGIIVNNGIVIVDYINQLRERGMEKREAILEAGKTRLRPVLMTALTTILGLSTMALSNDMGADLSKPMAVVTIGGLMYGTLLTLVVIPCIYDIFSRKDKAGV